MTKPSWFGLFCLGEGGLVLVAAGLGWVFGLDPWLTWKWDGRAVGLGVIGTLPPLGLLVWVLNSGWQPVVELREHLEGLFRETFADWRLWQFGVVSLLAGLGEESLFRGVIQAGLAGGLGSVGALVAASVLFGLAHPISGLYVVLAGAMGLWFGALWWWSGSLVTPVLAHALYDFIALAWSVKRVTKTG